MLSYGAKDLWSVVTEWYAYTFIFKNATKAEEALAKAKARYFPVFEKVWAYHYY